MLFIMYMNPLHPETSIHNYFSKMSDGWVGASRREPGTSSKDGGQERPEENKKTKKSKNLKDDDR
jgi:hypothetical protein